MANSFKKRDAASCPWGNVGPIA